VFRQILCHGRELRIDPTGITLTAHGRCTAYPGAFLAAAFGDPEDPFACWGLAADGWLWQLARGRRATRYWPGVQTFAASAGLLAAARAEGTLLLQGRSSCTTAALPPPVQALAALARDGDRPHLVLAAHGQGLSGLLWHEETGALHPLALAQGTFPALLLLDGATPVAVARAQGLPYHRVYLWRIGPGAWLGEAFAPLPPVLLHPDGPLAVALRSGGELRVAGGLGTWLALEPEGWRELGPVAEYPAGSLVHAADGIEAILPAS
jgi:hypothetical protein